MNHNAQFDFEFLVETQGEQKCLQKDNENQDQHVVKNIELLLLKHIKIVNHGQFSILFS